LWKGLRYGSGSRNTVVGNGAVAKVGLSGLWIDGDEYARDVRQETKIKINNRFVGGNNINIIQ
jgi:hypothetical protein